MNLTRTGFSLIELLVVISIIAVLASMLMPGITMVRNQAKRMACASNLRQVGVAIEAYGNDNEGNLASAAIIGAGITIRWSELLADYTETKMTGGNIDLTAGKSVLVGCTRWKSDPINAGWKVGYGINFQADMPARWSATNRWDYRAVTSNMVNFTLSQISFPSSRQLVMDATDYMSQLYDLKRHEGRCNTLFFDMHVQAINTVTQASNTYINPAVGL